MKPTARIILSNTVEQGKTAKDEPILSVVNPFITVNPKYFPTQYSFTVTILTHGINMTGEETMSLQVISPSGKIVAQTGDIPTPSMPIGSNITMNLDFKNFDLSEEGEFQVIFHFNDDFEEGTSFFVVNLPKENK